MTTPTAGPRSVLPRVLIAAATGAVLALGARSYHSWAAHRGDRICRATDGLCITWWTVTAIPLVVTVCVIVLTAVYKRLGIRPRLVIVPPTILLAPIPLAAADATAGWWAVVLTGGAWSGCLALAAWSGHRPLALAASAAMLLAAMAVYYH